MKILVTGGHLTPALAFLDYALSKGNEIIFVGRSHSSDSHGIKSREEIESTNRGVIFEQIDSIKLHRHNKFKSLKELPKLLLSLKRAKNIIKSHQPDIIVSFGGYLAVPIVLVAKMQNIPIFTHEQTKHIGLANRLIIKYADVVGVSWKNTKIRSKNKEVVLTGNPIRKQIKSKPKKPSWVKSSQPIIYVTGGNQGSLIINQMIQRLISKLTKQYYVIHQCGGFGSDNYVEKLKKTKEKLPKIRREKYLFKEWFSANEVSWILDNAMCVISRSGANTITEIIYKNTPSILIPLPYASQNEQFFNAKILSDQDAGIIIPQSKLTNELLLNSINDIQKNNQKYKSNIKHLKETLIVNAEENIYKIVKNLHVKNQTKKTI
jgi:UDP-N-acetylglucosamine--N-acetylmuramyl-(pentapeptide) pyrophosphoryl-undecaprenol N-acetylglucosamine transferase